MALALLFLAASILTPNALVAKTEIDDNGLVVDADAQTRKIVSTLAAVGSKRAEPNSPLAMVRMELFYESRCPDSLAFINSTLKSMWQNEDLRPHIDIALNPYGNAMSVPTVNISDGYKFWHPETTGKGFDHVHVCQHGPEECLGSLIQACAISSVKREQYMDLVMCMADKPKWGIEKSSVECMQQAKIDAKLIKECATSPVGNKLFTDLGKLTSAVQDRHGVPWVLVNGKSLAKQPELMQNICGALGDGGPNSCKKLLGKAGSSVKAPVSKGDFTVLPEIEEMDKATGIQAVEPSVDSREI